MGALGEFLHKLGGHLGMQHRSLRCAARNGAGQFLGLNILQQVRDRAGFDGREDLVVVGE